MSEPPRRSAGSPLRRPAEARGERLIAADVEAMTADEARAVVRELRLHQLELEMQNEELRRARSELEQSRDELRESEERYRSLYEFAPVGYLTLDSDGTIGGANLSAGRILRFPRARLVGRKLSDFVVPADQDRWYLERRAVAGGEGAAVFELELETDGGSGLHAELSLSLVEGSDRRPALIRAAMLDVSHRRREEIALRTAAAEEVLAEQRERRDLAEVLHGEIEQGLAIAGMKLAALHEAHPRQASREIAGDLDDVSQRLAAFGAELCPTMLFDLGIVAAAQWLAEDLERRAGLKVCLAGDGEIEGVDEVVRIVLFQALRELLMAAARSAPSEGAMVRVWREDSLAHLEVGSRGLVFGASAEQESSRLLGIRRRIEHLGGHLEVLSDPGQGARAFASLPLHIDLARLGEAAS